MFVETLTADQTNKNSLLSHSPFTCLWLQWSCGAEANCPPAWGIWSQHFRTDNDPADGEGELFEDGTEWFGLGTPTDQDGGGIEEALAEAARIIRPGENGFVLTADQFDGSGDGYGGRYFALRNVSEESS